MSRFIKNSIPVPSDVNINISDGTVHAAGPAGKVSRRLDDTRLVIEQNEGALSVRLKKEGDNTALALAGTYWCILNGMVKGAKDGVEKILDLVGVGYRVQVQGATVVLQLGFSHPVNYALPDGVTATAATQTEIVIKGADKMLVGQTAADIRAYRPPEPYKGKGVRYRNERVIIKETKKK